MRKFFFILLFLPLSCGGEKETLVDIESFLSQGKKIDLVKKKNFNKKNINLISKVDTNTIFDFSESKKKKEISVKSDKFLIYQNKIITIDNHSRITLFNLNLKKITSKKIYSRKIYKNYKIIFSIAANKNYLFISDNLGNLHAFDVKNLKLLWKKNLGVPFLSNIQFYKKDLFILNSNSKIFSFNQSNGKLNWSFETLSNNFKDSKSYQLKVIKDYLLFTNNSGEIYCLNLKSNSTVWSLVFGNDTFENVPIIFKSGPISYEKDGTLIISTNKGLTYNFNTDTGETRWSSQIYSLNKFLVTKKYLFNVFENNFFIIDKLNGKILLNKKITNPKNIFLFTNLLIGKNKIYLYDVDGFVISIEKKDLNNISIDKIFKNFLNYKIYKNHLFINTGYSIIKY